jgi:hypothetical protein
VQSTHASRVRVLARLPDGRLVVGRLPAARFLTAVVLTAHLGIKMIKVAAFAFGLGDAGEEAVADVLQAGALGGVDSQERAADAAFTELILKGDLESGELSRLIVTDSRHRRSWVLVAFGCVAPRILTTA